MLNSAPLGTILLVNSDENITGLLKFNLSSEGFGLQIITKAADVDPSSITNVRLIIADAMDQEFTGEDLCRSLKSDPSTTHIPIIICSERTSEDSVISAFDAGAEDFIAKPFSLRELVARIKSILRRYPIHNSRSEYIQIKHSEILTIEKLNLRIDLENQKVAADGTTIPLTKTEYAILIFLLRNQNNFFSRDEICNEIWKGEAGVNTRVVDTNISRMRKKLGDTGRHIINRYGLGYAFVEDLS